MSPRPLALISFLSLTLAVAIVAPPVTAQTTHHIPMSLIGQHPRIEVRIDGVERPLSFVVDTAAGASVVDVVLAEQLALIDTTRNIANVQGAGGAATGVRVTRLLELGADAYRWKAQMLALDLSHIAQDDGPPIDGILGNDLMSRFDVRFDLPGGRLTLAPTGSLPRTQCLDNAQPDRKPGLRRFAFVPAQLGDGAQQVEAMAVVDTGAAQTVLNRAAAQALGLADDDARLRRRAVGTRGLSTHTVDTWLYALPRLTIAGQPLPAREVRVSALPVFATLGLDATPGLILGVDALRDRAVDVLAGAEAVCFGPVSATAP